MRIGAIVLAAQDVERYLKAVLPFMDSRDPSIGAALRRHRKLERSTLGPLIDQLTMASVSPCDDFRQQVGELVKRRNDVVHRFAETYGSQLKTGQHQQVVASLWVLEASLLAMRDALAEAVACLLEALRDTTFLGTPEYGEMVEACASFRRAARSVPGS
ncbi:hypothetical protein [Frateuria sp. YIM B11624]|uniref:hypothetical protein n=1 Tax=Frateuria sp. YIM B11624 TaxID=3143185 RepID=UPI003C729006